MNTVVAERDLGRRMKENELIFVLDIGTRSVIGVVGRVKDGLLEVLRVETAEHSQRAVVDGQIQNIEQTARVAGQVKQRIEQGMGITLREVHVAAAGRVLKTERAGFALKLDERRAVTTRELLQLEAGAVQQAYEQLAQTLDGQQTAEFCCVGHSVVGYQLDGFSFSTLVGHRGKEATVELIATFLPSEVVESLYATMSAIGLSIASMTLEPIAAMNAVVPQELRLLNLALVDVGAGTSDIAVADGGTVCGYTMATVAGDEITERIMQELLVDFTAAEQMKLQLSQPGKLLPYSDVLGFEYEISTDELAGKIAPAVEELAQSIAAGIRQAGGGNTPKAVFLVGGGSRTPGLCTMVAKALGVDEKRVAVGGSNYMKRMVLADEQYLQAEYATPIGIAVTAITAGGGEGFAVTLNGTKLQLIGAGAMNVMEALLRGGYQYSQIMARSGESVVFEYNGERRMVRGELPTLAKVEVNGVLAGLSAPLKPGDEITFEPAQDGQDAAPLLRDVAAPWQAFEVELFGQKVPAGSRGWVNDQPAEGDTPIGRADRVRTAQIATVGQLLADVGWDGALPQIEINGKPCSGAQQLLAPGDRLTPPGTQPAPKVKEAPATKQKPAAKKRAAQKAKTLRKKAAAPKKQLGQPLPVEVSAQRPPVVPATAPQALTVEASAQAPVDATGVAANGPVASPGAPVVKTILLNGRNVQLLPKADGSPHLFFDLFNYVDIDPTKPQGQILLRRNGSMASYLDALQEGDNIEIRWVKP